MNSLRTQNIFDRARIIPTHIKRLSGVAISIPFMGFKTSRSSRSRLEQDYFLCNLTDTVITISSQPHKNTKANSSFMVGSPIRQTYILRYLENGTTQDMCQHLMLIGINTGLLDFTLESFSGALL